MDEQNQQPTVETVEATQQQEQTQPQQPGAPSGEVTVDAPQDLEYAGFLTRLIAILIDAVIISLIGAVLGIPGFKVVAEGTSFEVAGSGFLPFLIYGTYFAIMDVKFGQSLGKMAMKIRVQRVDSDENLDFVGAALREYIGRFICALTLGIGYLWVIWDPKKQGFHDKIGKSVVVKVKK